MAELPILHSKRAAYDWVERLRTLREAYDRSLVADPERGPADRRWLDAQLVHHALLIKGVEPTDEAAAPVAAAVARVREAVAEGLELTPSLLLEINGLVDPVRGGTLRDGPPVPAYQGHESPPPETLEALLGNAADWFTAPSFLGDFHPVEQTALAMVRICDLQPFPSSNELTARIAAQLFLLREGWPPAIVRSELEADYRRAILHAMHMDTQPIVDLLAQSVELTLAGDLANR